MFVLLLNKTKIFKRKEVIGMSMTPKEGVVYWLFAVLYEDVKILRRNALELALHVNATKSQKMILSVIECADMVNELNQLQQEMQFAAVTAEMFMVFNEDYTFLHDGFHQLVLLSDFDTFTPELFCKLGESSL